MELLARADETALLWLNDWVGRFPALDAIVRLVVSDYLIPVLLCLTLLALWFAGRTASSRERNQRGVITALIGLGFANLSVEIMNNFVFRPRPFADLEVTLLFYRPTDSSFPANPAAFGFAVATAVWLWNRKVGAVLFGLATLFAFSLVFAGVFYPLDVVGGAAIGVIVSLLVALGLRRIEPLPTLALRLARAVYLA